MKAPSKEMKKKASGRPQPNEVPAEYNAYKYKTNLSGRPTGGYGRFASDAYKASEYKKKHGSYEGYEGGNQMMDDAEYERLESDYQKRVDRGGYQGELDHIREYQEYLGSQVPKAKKGMRMASNGWNSMGGMGKAGAIAGMAGTAMQIYGSNFSNTDKNAGAYSQIGAGLSQAGGTAMSYDKGKTPKYRKGVKRYRKGGRMC